MCRLSRLALIGLAGWFSALCQPANIPGTAAALGKSVFGVAVDSKGNAFLPLRDFHMVVRLDAGTGLLTVVAGTGTAGSAGDNGPATSAQLYNPWDVALDSAGNVYIADFNNRRVRRVSNGVITTVAGGGSSLGDNGPATSGQLIGPLRVTVDSAGNLYIADWNGSRVRKVSNGVITTVAGNGVSGFSGDNGPAANAQLSQPYGVAVDSSDNLYIADYYNHRIRKVSNGVITTVAGTGTAGFNGDNIAATSAQLSYPSGVAADAAGNLFVADSGNTRLRKVSVSNGVITTVAGNGTCCFAGDNGPATNGQLDGPVDVAVDSGGNLYIADGARLLKVSNGVLTTVAGNGQAPPAVAGTYSASKFAGGGLPINIPGTSASLGVDLPQCLAADRRGSVFFAGQAGIMRLDAVTGLLSQVAGGVSGLAIAVDRAGDVYVAEGARIRKISGGVVTTVAGNGTAGFSGDGGPATSAQLNSAIGVAVDAFGNIYIADAGNFRIRKVSDGVITTVAGDGTRGPSGDNGPAKDAKLGTIYALAADAGGNIYIADTFGRQIRMVSRGVITTVAGNGNAGSTGDGGPASGARVYEVRGLAVDQSGDLYISDVWLNSIRKVSGGVITRVAGGGAQVGDNGPAITSGLYHPYGVAVDAGGNVYIADSGNRRIRKVSDGIITTVAGGGAEIGDGGPATSAQLTSPAGLAFDAAGNLYIADTGNDRIRKVSKGSITSVAGSGSLGFYYDTSPAANAKLYNPYGVTVDAAGSIYAVDTSPAFAPSGISINRIRKVSNGVLNPIAEVPGHTAVTLDAAGNLYFTDILNKRVRKVSDGKIDNAVFAGSAFGAGEAVIADLNYPAGITFDTVGNLYIADSNHNRILKVTGKQVSTFAGNGKQGSSGDGGPATDAPLFLPWDLAMGSDGVLYITESSRTIRKVSNGIISTVASVPVKGLAVDSAGKVYFTSGDTVSVLTPVPCSYAVTPTSSGAPSTAGKLTVSVQTSATCSWTVASPPGWITLSGVSGTGSAAITLTMTANSGAPRSATISIAGTAVQITQSNLPAISAGGIVNTASSAGGSAVAAGSIVTVYGNFTGVPTVSADSSTLPFVLGGLSVQFLDGTKAPLFFVSASQVNFQVPWNRAGATQAGISISVNGQTGPSMGINIAPYAPGIFSINAQGSGQGAVLDTSYRLVDSSNPVRAGMDTIQIYCTGLGPVTNQPPGGTPALSSPLSQTSARPTVTIGGAPATVLFSGLAPGAVGEYQVNVLVPAGSVKGAAVPLALQVGGVTSNTVTIAVQ